MKKILLFILSLGLAVGVLGACFGVNSGGNSSSNGGQSSQSSYSSSNSSAQAQTFTVVFRQSGQNPIERKVKEGEALTNVPDPAPKTGYTVTWSVTDFSCVTKNMEVTAVETANTYTITYDAGEGTASATTQKVTYDQAPESFATATRAGYDFVAWTYNGKAVQATEIWKIASDVTLVAEWTPVEVVEYTVSFVQDGYETVIRTVAEGGSLAATDIPATQPKVGYTVEWEEKDLTNITGNVTVNAVATANTYTITYDAGEGTPSVETQEVTYDQAPESFATATLEGYDFVAWTYEGKVVQPTEIWKIASDVTLVATWLDIAVEQYTVSFVQDGCQTITVTVAEGGSLEAKDIPTPQGKVGYTVEWEEKDLTNITGNITVNAVATANTYTITYDAGEGTPSVETQEVTYDKAPGSFATATREGYEFVAWTYNGTAVQATEIWTIASDVTLVAEWSAVVVTQYTVSFVQDGCQTITVTVAEGGSLSSADIPAPQGKVGYTVKWEEKDLTNITGNITVNAVTTANTHTITYNAAGGTASAQTQGVTYDKAPESFATAERDGYKFKGWAYNGEVLSASALWKIDENVTLTAVWAKIYTITLELDGGSLDTTTITVVEGEAYNIPKPTKGGSNFSGWYYGNTKVEETGIWSLSADGHSITLKAGWQEKEWTNNY